MLRFMTPARALAPMSIDELKLLQDTLKKMAYNDTTKCYEIDTKGHDAIQTAGIYNNRLLARLGRTRSLFYADSENGPVKISREDYESLKFTVEAKLALQDVPPPAENTNAP